MTKAPFCPPGGVDAYTRERTADAVRSSPLRRAAYDHGARGPVNRPKYGGEVAMGEPRPATCGKHIADNYMPCHLRPGHDGICMGVGRSGKL